MVVKISVNSLSFKNEFSEGRMDLLAIVECARSPPRHALHPTLLRFSPPPHPTLTATFCCRKVYEMRADGISPDVRHFASTDDEYLEELRQACTRRGLRID